MSNDSITLHPEIICCIWANLSIVIISNVLNEICNGIKIYDFETKIGGSFEVEIFKFSSIMEAWYKLVEEIG